MKKFSFLLLIAIIFSSCKTFDPRPPGGNWRVVSIVLDNGVTISPQGDITMNFNENESRISGKALCNSYGAKFAFTDQLITFTEIISTEAICGDSLSDRNFFLGLRRAQTFIRTDTTFTIRGYDSVAEINFIPINR